MITHLVSQDECETDKKPRVDFASMCIRILNFGKRFCRVACRISDDKVIGYEANISSAYRHPRGRHSYAGLTVEKDASYQSEKMGM